jgi:hypothetical protein
MCQTLTLEEIATCGFRKMFIWDGAVMDFAMPETHCLTICRALINSCNILYNSMFSIEIDIFHSVCI